MITKIIKIVEVQLNPNGGCGISFVEYTPDVEKVNPALEQMRRATEGLGDMIPKDQMERVTSFFEAVGTSMSQLDSRGVMHYAPSGHMSLPRSDAVKLGGIYKLTLEESVEGNI